MINASLARLADYPFTRLAQLLEPIVPPGGVAPLALSVGEPQHAPPALLAETLAASADGWNRYPQVNGTPALREAIAGWLKRRYRLGDGTIDPDRSILPLSGTREGLFLLAQLAAPGEPTDRTPAILLPNPFYAAYEGAAVIAGAEPVFLDATAATGFLPDLDALDRDLLDRARLFYLCTPANPQGAAADAAYMERAIGLARRHGFILAVDECYAEIYDRTPPTGALEVAARMDGGALDNLLVFHSLSKRSNAAGLRSGFVAGDPKLIAAFAQLRSYAMAGMPLAIQAASAALWNDDAHVEENRARYRAAFDAAHQAIGDRFGFYRPDGGFFLWLDVGDGEDAARDLWRAEGLRVLPGAYITRPDRAGRNHGAPYIRVALVHDAAIVADAMARLTARLDARPEQRPADRRTGS